MDTDRIDRFREQWQYSASGEELPDQDQLIDAEEMLLIRIPRPMRAFLLWLSDLQPVGWELVTCHDPFLHSYLPEVTALAWDEGLPRYLIPLAFNASSYAAVDDSAAVHIWSKQLKEAVDQFDSIESWIETGWQ